MNVASIKASAQSTYVSATESLSDEATQRTVLGYIAATVVSYAVASITFTVLSYLLWAWLSFVIATLAAYLVAVPVMAYTRADGYDHAVNACASVLTFFRKVRSTSDAKQVYPFGKH